MHKAMSMNSFMHITEGILCARYANMSKGHKDEEDIIPLLREFTT